MAGTGRDSRAGARLSRESRELMAAVLDCFTHGFPGQLLPRRVEAQLRRRGPARIGVHFDRDEPRVVAVRCYLCTGKDICKTPFQAEILFVEGIVSLDWGGVFQRLKDRIKASGVSVKCRRLGPETTGVFDGLSITTNSACDLETQCHNMGHAFGHIAQWSLEFARCQELYETLYSAKDRKFLDPPALEQALQEFRSYEEEASEYAAWLLIDTGNAAAIASFTPFARADIEAIVSYHRDGIAPIWSEFFEAWRARARRGEIVAQEFVPKRIPPFQARSIEPQEVIQGVRGTVG